MCLQPVCILGIEKFIVKIVLKISLIIGLLAVTQYFVTQHCSFLQSQFKYSSFCLSIREMFHKIAILIFLSHDLDKEYCIFTRDKSTTSWHGKICENLLLLLQWISCHWGETSVYIMVTGRILNIYKFISDRYIFF